LPVRHTINRSDRVDSRQNTCSTFSLKTEQTWNGEVAGLESSNDPVEGSLLARVEVSLVVISISLPPVASLVGVGIVSYILGPCIALVVLLYEALVVVLWALESVLLAGGVALSEDVLQVLVGPLSLLLGRLIPNARRQLIDKVVEEALSVWRNTVHAGVGEEASERTTAHAFPGRLLQRADPYVVVLEESPRYSSIMVSLVGIVRGVDTGVAIGVHHRLEIIPGGWACVYVRENNKTKRGFLTTYRECSGEGCGEQ
jgi:hypothetical protein